MNSPVKVVLLLIATIAFVNANAQDRHFAWTYESTTLPKGNIDFEPWITYSSGHNNFYHALETRLEVEFGLSNRLQTAVYFNSKHQAFADMDELGRVKGINSTNSFSISNEWKFNVLNPSTKPIGLGLYGEYTLGPQEIELEYKVLIDKRFGQDIIAFNHIGELEFEFEAEEEVDGEVEIEIEREFVLEHSLAYIHMFNRSFGLGAEIFNSGEFEGGKFEHAALYAGPTLFFTQNNYFLILNIQPQITDAIHFGELDLEHGHQMQARLLVGISL